MEATQSSDQARELDRADWGPYFEELNRRLEGGTEMEAAIEVAGEAIDGTVAELLPLDSITYEDGDDEIAIGLGGHGQRFPAALWHYADKPVRVWVHEHGGVPTAIGIESDDGTYTFVRLSEAGAG